MLLETPQLKAIAAILLVAPFVPLLFQGEEWGARTPFIYFTDHENEELGLLVTEGRTQEFKAFDWGGEVPNPQAPESFERSKLNWRELDDGCHPELLEWYRRLIALRHAALGGFEHTVAAVASDAAAAWFTFTVADLLIAFNFSREMQPVPMPVGDWELLLSSAGACDRAALEFPASGTRIFKRR